MDYYIKLPANNGVTSLNGEAGAITLIAGPGISITPSGQDITITNTEASSAVTTIGTFDGNGASANGLSISGNTLYAQSASTTDPGMVNNTTQSLSGNKTFTGQTAVSNTSTTALTVNSTTLVVDATNDAVGIGIAPATTAVLDVINESGSNKAIQATGYGSNVGFRGRRADGTFLSPTASQSGDALSFFSGRGYGATGFAVSSTGVVNVVAGAAFTDTSMPTYIQFLVTPTASVTAVEAARIAPTGNVLIGTTTDSGTQKLQVNGNSAVGTITSGLWNGTVTAGFSTFAGGTTYTTPANITTATLFKFTVIGGGGGGGGINSANEGASGGGGGGVGIVWLTGLSPSTGYTYSIGAGGAGGANTGNTAGSNGGATSITINATTYTANGGTGAPAKSSDTAGGAGGTTSLNFSLNYYGSAGGGSSATAGVPSGAGGYTSGAGTGGASNTVSGNGLAGHAFGGGGAGGKGTGAGGAGAQGGIIVEWQN